MKNEKSLKKLADQYRKSVRWSEEDGCYVGTVHDLIGDCCHGDNPVEVYRELEQVTRDCVEVALGEGKALPRSESKLKEKKTPPKNAAEIRKIYGMSQRQFADFLQISPKTLHKWEQETSQPSGAARSLLQIASSRPKVVKEVLGG